jgi:hypothetical protein
MENKNINNQVSTSLPLREGQGEGLLVEGLLVEDL